MTFGQIYGALKKGRWVGRSTKENERLSLMDGRILKSICADGEVLVYVYLNSVNGRHQVVRFV